MEIIYKILAAVGGIGIVVIGLSKFLGSILRDRLKESQRRQTELDLEATQYRRVQADRFVNTQFDVYLELWETLQALRLAVDTLWHKATKPNIATLALQLRKTKEKVNNWSLFFDDNHLQELLRLLQNLEKLRAGKIRLFDIRSREDMKYVYPKEIESQVQENRQSKEQFDNLLENLRRSFRDRLSSIKYNEAN